MNRSHALIVMSPSTVRDRLTSMAEAEGIHARTADDVLDALAKIRASASPVSVLVIDEQALRWDAIVLSSAQRTDHRVAALPLVVLARDQSPAIAAGLANVRATVTYADGVTEVAAALAQAVRVDRPAPQPTTDPTSEPVDLHAYALDKLVQYLGAARANELFHALTARLPARRIKTSADLHAIAAKLRAHGQIEAALATLFSGRATLLDSVQALRRR